MSAVYLGHRFFILTAVGYITALVSCAAVVWTLSVPFLRAAQTEHLQDVARQQASAAAFMLDEVYDRAEYLTRIPAIVDLVTGQTDSVSVVSDRIHTFTTPDTLRVKVLDYEGRTLYASQTPDLQRTLFFDVEFGERFSEFGQVANRASRAGRLQLRQDREAERTHILVGVPILVSGVVEGAIVMEKRLATHSALPGGSALITPFQRALVPETSGAITAQVPGVPLLVRLGEGATTFAADGSHTATLVSRIALGLSFVLLVPFLTMSYFGAKHLVAPTQALARSRVQLTEQKDQLRRQSDELRELAAVAELSRDAVTVTDRQGKILWVNHAFTELTGYTQDEVRGRSPGAFLQTPATDTATVKRIREGLRNGMPVRAEILNKRKSGESYWIAISISPISGEDGTVARFAAISSDITERRAVQEALASAQRETEYRATHDPLTGLPNRRYLDHVLSNEVSERSTPRTIIRADLDFFKNVNDTHGHAAGDHVLKVVSEALLSHSRQGDLVARVGGDEFVVLLEKGTTTETADALCERYRLEIRKDIVFDGKTCRVGASFGVASALDGLVGNDQLLLGADAALYASKARGRNTTTLYTPEVHADVINKRRSAIEIERAIERREFEPYFQLQVDAQSRVFAGLEALVRWNHPEQGVLPPSAFLPLAEQLSLVPEIDEIVYRRGLETIQTLNAEGHNVPKVSFNVGAKQLENPLLHTIHKQFDLGRTKIAFEVLESVLIEEQSHVFAFQIDMLRDLGFEIEIDDFGSGHASIVGLMHLRPDVMKLDQRLVAPLTEDPHAVTTVRSLVEIGRSLGIRITAEGVETEDHAVMLADLGVDTLQGFRFAKPLPLSALPGVLTDLQKHPTAVA